jgi:polyferredoxin/formate hydrogenlyase subunit 6/NADH:ubiquinone oxidoreductase subunit I
MRMRTVRRLVQLFCLGLFGWLLLGTRWQPGGRFPAQPFFLRLDPLGLLMSALSPVHRLLPYFVPAMILIALTLLLGRFFCGWVCPLGTMLDICETVLWRRRAAIAPRAQARQLKYYLLAAVLAAALFGTQLGWLLDPIALLTRTAATVFVPVGQALYHGAVRVGGPLLRVLGLRAYLTPIHVYSLNLAAGICFAVIVALSYFSRRYWCRNVCPLGALLGLLGRWGLWRRWVTGCLRCMRCSRACKMGAIPPQDPSQTQAAECILCYDCLTCPQPGIVHLGLAWRSPGHHTQTGMTRRGFLVAAGLGLAYGATAATGLGRRATRDKLIRPPGAIQRRPDGSPRLQTEEEFRAACLRCGNCMKVCPTGGLQPALWEAGWDGLYTPILVPTVGWCEQSCNACGQVCPSGALRPFTVAEKPRIKIGRAHISQGRCLSWQRGDRYKLCLVCAEHCPYGAVEVIVYEGRRRPQINEEKCVGCGLCENKCPVAPEKAITVQRREPQ